MEATVSGELMTVWIAFEDLGSEGKSEPLAAFGSERLAKIYQAGADAAHGYSVKIKALPIIGEITSP